MPLGATYVVYGMLRTALKLATQLRALPLHFDALLVLTCLYEETGTQLHRGAHSRLRIMSFC